MNFFKKFGLRNWPLIGSYIKTREWRAKMQLMARVRKFPSLRISKEDLDGLPMQRGLDVNRCTIGTCFICRPYKYIPDIVVIGQVVNLKNILEDQIHSDSIVSSDRGINRFLAEVVEKV